MERGLSSAPVPESARRVLSLSFSSSQICVGILRSGSWECFGLFPGAGGPSLRADPGQLSDLPGMGQSWGSAREPLPSMFSQTPAQSTARIQARAAEPGLCKLLICGVKRHPRAGLPLENVQMYKPVVSAPRLQQQPRACLGSSPLVRFCHLPAWPRVRVEHFPGAGVPKALSVCPTDPLGAAAPCPQPRGAP